MKTAKWKMQISGDARPFEICNLSFAFYPAEAGKFSQNFKGLNRYENRIFSKFVDEFLIQPSYLDIFPRLFRTIQRISITPAGWLGSRQ
jgi:hypothetical protein